MSVRDFTGAYFTSCTFSSAIPRSENATGMCRIAFILATYPCLNRPVAYQNRQAITAMLRHTPRTCKISGIIHLCKLAHNRIYPQKNIRGARICRFRAATNRSRSIGLPIRSI